MSIKPLSYHGFSLAFLVAGSNREKEGKRPGDITACWYLSVHDCWRQRQFDIVKMKCERESAKRRKSAPEKRKEKLDHYYKVVTAFNLMKLITIFWRRGEQIENRRSSFFLLIQFFKQSLSKSSCWKHTMSELAATLAMVWKRQKVCQDLQVRSANWTHSCRSRHDWNHSDG